ncbi:MAG: glucose-6-phosphate dehydrogenase [Spirochaetaceae bacterium]|nr:MAG: glucose-6-phosphate dehydrogenase [Spirochaetaceae bacterium]
MDHNPFREGLSHTRRADPVTVVIFGVTGDLTRRKLLPALFALYRKGVSRLGVIGFARRDWQTEGLRQRAGEILRDAPDATDEQRAAFVNQLSYVRSTFDETAGYRELARQLPKDGDRLFYLSTPPESYEAIIRNLGEAGLNRPGGGSIRVVVEKPFGRDLESARRLNRLLADYFDEQQIYRIDHYLGKETVQNIMLLRFGNGIFEPLWNHRYVEHIQITVSERLGVEGRGNYYDSAGALRDMVQNHMFQLLSLTAMEPPIDLQADSIRDEKVKVVRAIGPIAPSELDTHTCRGQYSSGYSDGTAVPGYMQEDGVPPDSRTETFVAIKLFVNNWRWSGVPFYLRTGKRLRRKVSEIAVTFRTPPLELYSNRHPTMTRNTLIIRIQPEEGITLTVNTKIPGYTTDMRPVNVDFAYGSAFGESTLEAYERLLFDALVGDSTLYTRRDEIEASWRFITQLLEGWQNSQSRPQLYEPGSSGPHGARALPGGAGHRWRKL